MELVVGTYGWGGFVGRYPRTGGCCNPSPARHLAEAYGRPAAEGIHSIPHFATSAGLDGQSFWITGLDAAGWPKWRQFFVGLTEEGSRVAAHKRPMLALVLTGVPEIELPPSGNYHTVHYWYHAITSIDVSCFCQSQAPLDDLSPLRRTLKRTIVEELAIWDLDLAADLLSNNLAALLDPIAFLAQWPALPRAELGAFPALRQSLWLCGLVASPEPDADWHSAYLARVVRERSGTQDAERATKTILRRLWKAQLKVIFPIVEEARLRLVEEYHTTLQRHLREFGATTDDLNEVELGSVLRVAKQFSLPTDLVRQVQVLVDIRNKLAHLKIIPESTFRRLEELPCLPKISG